MQLTFSPVYDKISFGDMHELYEYSKNTIAIFVRSAVLAQSVARRLGKAEVGGSSPLDSFDKYKGFLRVVYFVYLSKTLYICVGLHTKSMQTM